MILSIRKIVRKHWIELSIGGLLFFLLVIVSIPRFLNAQIRAQTVRAQKTLSELVDAILAYNLDTVGADIDSIDFTAESNQKRNCTIYSPTLRKQLWPVIKSRFQDIHIGRRNITFIDPNGEFQDMERPNRYNVYSSHRNSVQPYILMPIADYAITVLPFRAPPNQWPYKWPYIGIAAGPCLDVRLNESYAKDQTKNGFYGEIYDPSNGLISHGYLVYCATPFTVHQRK